MRRISWTLCFYHRRAIPTMTCTRMFRTKGVPFSGRQVYEMVGNLQFKVYILKGGLG